MKRLAIVTNIPAPYRKDLFERLSRSPSLHSKVFFTSRSEPNHRWDVKDYLDYSHEFVPSITVRRKGGEATHLCYGLFGALRKFKPDAIIVGGASIAALISAAYRKIYGAKVYVWWAGTLLSEKDRGGLTAWIRRHVFGSADGFLAYSNYSKAYLEEKFGIQQDMITVIGNNTIDAEKYGLNAVRERGGRRRRPGDAFKVISVAQLIPRKNVRTVIDAFSLFHEKYPNASLTIAGEGIEKEALKDYCARTGAKDVRFLGNVAPEELKRRYAETDILLSLASMDQTPQAVNEAMASGLPVIVSSTSAIDGHLVKDSVNGYIVEPFDRERVAGLLLGLANDPSRLKAMGEESFRIACSGDVSCALRKIEEALHGAARVAAAEPPGKYGALKKRRLLIISRVHAVSNGGVLFQRMDGKYIDRIASRFKSVEVLCPVHAANDPHYDTFKGHDYSFVSPNISITNLAPVDYSSRNIFKRVSAYFKQNRLIRDKVRSSDAVYVFMSTVAAVLGVRHGKRLGKTVGLYSGNDWASDARYQFPFKSGPLSHAVYPFSLFCGALERYAMKRADFKLVTSSAHFEKYSRYKGKMVRSLPVIAINAASGPSDEAPVAVDGGHLKVLTVCSLIPRKGIEFLIEGFAAASDSVGKAELHVVGQIGDAGYYDGLKALAKRLNVGDRIVWHGYVSDPETLAAIYRDSSVFVLASNSEGFPRVIFEAMLFGLPVVATNLPNIVSVLGKETAIYVPPADPGAISAALNSLANDNGLMERFSRAGKRFARSYMDKDAAAQFLELAAEQEAANRNGTASWFF